MKNRVIVQVPLKIERTVTQKQTRNDGRGVAWLGEKSNSREVNRTVEDISLIGYQGTTKRGIEEVLLGDRPADELSSRTIPVVARRLVRGLRLAGVCSRRVGREVPGALITLGARFGLLGEQAIDDAVLHAAGVGQNVAIVEADDVGKIADAGFVAVDRVRL